MLACRSIHHFGIDSESIFRILGVNVRADGGDTVIDLVTSRISPARLDAEHIHAHTTGEAVVALERDAGIELRSAAILDIIVRSSVRT